MKVSYLWIRRHLSFQYSRAFVPTVRLNGNTRQYNTDTDVVIRTEGIEESKKEFVDIKSDEDLPPYWKSLETRVLHRKNKNPLTSDHKSRSVRRSSAWDADAVKTEY